MSDATATISSPVTRVPGGRAKRRAGARHGAAGFLFTAPFMVLFLLVFIAPLVYALYLSLYREQLIGGNTFVGLDNYTDGLKDQAFIDGVQRVAIYMVIQVPIMLVLALIFALILDSGRVWLSRFLRVGIFVPYAVPVVIAALMWGYLYGKDFGPFADIADKLGMSAPSFLGEKTMLFSLANVATWTYTGYNMIILYAALRSIPTELYEAAASAGGAEADTPLGRAMRLPAAAPTKRTAPVSRCWATFTPEPRSRLRAAARWLAAAAGAAVTSRLDRARSAIRIRFMRRSSPTL